MSSAKLESTIRSQKNQILKTDFAKESGLGTAMHSKPGQASIQDYKVFQNSQDREELMRPFREKKEQFKQAKLLEALTMVEVDIIKQGFQLDLDEIRKIQQDKLQIVKKPVLEEEEDEETQPEPEDFLAQQLELFENKIKAKPGQDWEFNSVTRDHPRYMYNYYGPENTLGHVYYPDHKKVWKKTLSSVKMIPEEKETKPRTQIQNISECRTFDKNKTCSYQTRKLVREAKLGKEMTLSDRKLWLLKNLDSLTLKQTKKSLETEEERFPNTISPNKQGIMNIKFESYSKRHDLSVMLKNPHPGNPRLQPPSAHDSLFDHAPPNIEVLSRAKRTTTIPKFNLQTNRPSFVSEKAQPDLYHYQSEQFLNKQYQVKGLGAIQFDKRPQREFHSSPKPFKMPDGYDHDQIMKGYNLTDKVVKVKGKVDMGSQLPRDNVMYTKFNKEDLLAMQKRLGKKNFNFADYIPNSMKPKRPGSRVSLASTMIETPSLSRAMSGLPGGSMMGPKGIIHNYNPKSQFSLLNDASAIMKNSINTKSRNDTIYTIDGGDLEKPLPLKTVPSTHLTLDSTLMETPNRFNSLTTRKNQEFLQVNGSFLQIDSKQNKLVDLSTSMVHEPSTMITGLRQMKDIYSICARDEPWKINSKLKASEQGVITNDTSNRGMQPTSLRGGVGLENSQKDLSQRIFATLESQQRMRSVSYLN